MKNGGRPRQAERGGAAAPPAFLALVSSPPAAASKERTRQVGMRPAAQANGTPPRLGISARQDRRA